MTAPLAVRLDVHDRAASALHARVLASLPQSFRIAPPGRAVDAVLVSGAGVGWPAAAREALAGGAKGLMLTAVDPYHPDTRAALDRLRPPVGVAVTVDTPWAQHQALLDAAPMIAADLAAVTFIAGDFGVPASRRPACQLALDHLALVRAVAAPVVDVRLIATGEDGYELVGTADGCPVHLSAVVSPDGPERGELRLLAADRQWTVTFGDAGLANPPRLARADGRGETVCPAVFESGHRAAWRALHTAVTGGAAARYGLDALRADVTVLADAAVLPTGAVPLR